MDRPGFVKGVAIGNAALYRFGRGRYREDEAADGGRIKDRRVGEEGPPPPPPLLYDCSPPLALLKGLNGVDGLVPDDIGRGVAHIMGIIVVV